LTGRTALAHTAPMFARFIERARDERSRRALERQLDYQRAKARALSGKMEAQTAWRTALAREVRLRLEAVHPVPAEARVLEVGSGAHGHIFFFGAKNGIGVDPLADDCRHLFAPWQRGVRTVRGFGEALPFEDASFDVVISDNCVDHARDPRAILREIARVLVPGGLLYFTVNVHHPLYDVVSRMHGAWNALGVAIEITPFADHTVHLTRDAARALFDGLPFRIAREFSDIAIAKRDPRYLKTRHALDLVKRVFFKNALYEVVAERTR
jgi:SAM-dependent methyltransferase